MLFRHVSAGRQFSVAIGFDGQCVAVRCLVFFSSYVRTASTCGASDSSTLFCHRELLRSKLPVLLHCMLRLRSLGLEGEEPIRVATGIDHVVILTNSGKVYSNFGFPWTLPRSKIYSYGTWRTTGAALNVDVNPVADPGISHFPDRGTQVDRPRRRAAAFAYDQGLRADCGVRTSCCRTYQRWQVLVLG